MKSIVRRISWILFRRYLLKLKIKGFSAHLLSFAYRNCKFSEYCTLSGNVILYNTSLGRFSYLNSGSVSNAEIGSFTSIGAGVKIGGFGKHPLNWISTHPVFYSNKSPNKLRFSDKLYFDEYSQVTIGNDVWIGDRVMILDGVKIGNGAVIGAGSIVTKNIRPYEIVAGVPARNIRFRFSAEEIEKLESNPWWDQSIDFLSKNAALFRNDNITSLMSVLNNNKKIE